MPEGPQMVFLKEQAEPFIGQLVLKAEGCDQNFPFNQLKEQELIGMKTYGKELFLCFRSFAVRVHLMFFGKYALNRTVANRELQMGLIFEDGEINFYTSDIRFIQEPLDQLYDWSIDVMHPSFDVEAALKKLFQKPDRFICDALLDQNILAGVGNGIKNDALFRSRIHPESLAGEIPKQEGRNLISACVQLSFEYLDWLWEGADKKNWQAYTQKICPRDHTPFLKAKIGRPPRSCYFCDKCQRLYLPEM
jgi:endonuclease-8